jgi:hypothetical protein
MRGPQVRTLWPRGLIPLVSRHGTWDATGPEWRETTSRSILVKCNVIAMWAHVITLNRLFRPFYWSDLDWCLCCFNMFQFFPRYKWSQPLTPVMHVPFAVRNGETRRENSDFAGWGWWSGLSFNWVLLESATEIAVPCSTCSAATADAVLYISVYSNSMYAMIYCVRCPLIYYD